MKLSVNKNNRLQLTLNENRKLEISVDEIYEYLFLCFSLILAVILRISLIDYISNDYINFLEPWYDFIKSHGGFRAMKFKFANYTPPYLYLMAIATYLPIPKMYAIKLISIIFDFVAAIFVYKIIKIKYKNKFLLKTSYLITLFAPTLVLNSTVWGQCDIIYTTFLLASVYYLIKKKNTKAFIFYSIAFSFKLQSVFLFSLFLIMFLKGEVKLRQFFIIPITYIIFIFPSWIAGRPFLDLLEIYIEQKNAYKQLSLEAPNLYQWLPDEHFELISKWGLITAAFVIILLCFIAYKNIDKVNKEIIIKLSLLSALIVPYILPQMHDRYFFVADIIGIIYAFYFPKYFYVPLATWFSSFFSCYSFIFYKQPFISTEYLAFIPLALIIILSVDLARYLKNSSITHSQVNKTGALFKHLRVNKNKRSRRIGYI